MNLHNSELKNISDFVNGHEGSITCNACNSFAQWGIDNICKDFLEKYWDWEKNKNINPWKITKSCANPYVYLKCQEIDYHKSYKITCHKFVDNRRCPYCNPRKNKVHVLDSLGTLFPEVLKIWSDKNKKSPYEYSLNSGKYVWWKCSEGKHEDYYRSIHSSNSYKFRCPECINEKNESLLQEKVRLYLNELGYIILHENNCTLKCINPITKYPLHYDNEVKLNNKPLLIEVNGIQHYKITGFHTLASIKNNSTPEQELKYQKEKDKYKKEYALLHGYEFLTIPYYTDDKDETWKNLINNKINIILNN